jgi:hypothetical protein
MPKRILIAEDEASVRNAIRTFSEARSPFEVFEAIGRSVGCYSEVNLFDLRNSRYGGHLPSFINVQIAERPRSESLNRIRSR